MFLFPYWDKGSAGWLPGRTEFTWLLVIYSSQGCKNPSESEGEKSESDKAEDILQIMHHFLKNTPIFHATKKVFVAVMGSLFFFFFPTSQNQIIQKLPWCGVGCEITEKQGPLSCNKATVSRGKQSCLLRINALQQRKRAACSSTQPLLPPELLARVLIAA